jgi:hypothetical protein
MADNLSVVSNASAPDMNEMMAVLDAPVAPKSGKKVLKAKKSKEVITPLAIEPTVETPIETDIAPVEEMNYKELYEALLEKYNALIESQKKPKNDNSPDIENGVHMRMVNGVKTKTRYIFPYQADGGKSIVKDMKDGMKCVGVSTTQKNNSKGSCKVADYDLIWVNAKVVKDVNTGKVYPHKDGKFAIMDEDAMTTFNVRMMIVAE